jgi:hypothetical protein
MIPEHGAETDHHVNEKPLSGYYYWRANKVVPAASKSRNVVQLRTDDSV